MLHVSRRLSRCCRASSLGARVMSQPKCDESSPDGILRCHRLAVRPTTLANETGAAAGAPLQHSTSFSVTCEQSRSYFKPFSRWPAGAITSSFSSSYMGFLGRFGRSSPRIHHPCALHLVQTRGVCYVPLLLTKHVPPHHLGWPQYGPYQRRPEGTGSVVGTQVSDMVSSRAC